MTSYISKEVYEEAVDFQKSREVALIGGIFNKCNVEFVKSNVEISLHPKRPTSKLEL